MKANAVRRIRAAIRHEWSLETDTRSDFSSGDFLCSIVIDIVRYWRFAGAKPPYKLQTTNYELCV
jgi:hypothetical protein